MSSNDPRVVLAKGTRSGPRVFFLLFLSGVLLTLTSVGMTVLGLLSAFSTRRFQTEVVARWLCRTILSLWGIRVVLRGDANWPRGQVVYLANHSSTLDPFILVSLGLPRTRYFLSGTYKRALPFALINLWMGTFFTPPQTDREARVACFRDAERVLRRTGDSVYLSPEGKRVTTGDIGPFNKGAFHLAATLGVPICPLFISIPEGIDPGMGFVAGAGTVEVEALSSLSTEGWQVERAAASAANVHRIYVEHKRCKEKVCV